LGWNLTAVTGNATFTAQWTDDMSLFEQKIADLENQVLVLTQQINCPLTGFLMQLAESNALAQARLTRIGELEGEIETHLATIKARDEVITDINKELDNLKEDLKNANQLSSDRLKTIGELLDDIEGLETDIGELNGKIADLERLNGELETANGELQAIINENPDLETLQALLNQIEELEGDIETIIGEIEELLLDLSVADFNALRGLVASLNSEIDALNLEIAEILAGQDDNPSLIESVGFWLIIASCVVLMIAIILFMVKVKKRRDTTKNIFSKL
jgi:DNA repair exonuclease SbcCD ATPase subunit